MNKTVTDILLLEDDPDISTMLISILKFEGYPALSCNTPVKLYELIRVHHPRLILMDMLLSGADGRDICVKLKNDPETQHIRIIMMSAHPDAEVTCKHAGADDFISKPFDFDHFISRVKKGLVSA